MTYIEAGGFNLFIQSACRTAYEFNKDVSQMFYIFYIHKLETMYTGFAVFENP